MRLRLCLAAAGVAVLLAASSLAQSADDPLAEARELMDAQEYEPARAAIRRIISEGRLMPAQFAEAHSRAAECAAALRIPDEARDAYVRLLAANPGYRLPSVSSPLVREPFQQALEFWRNAERPRVRYEPPPSVREGEPFVVEPSVVVGQVPSLVATVTLYVVGPDGDQTSFDVVDGRAEIPASMLEGREGIDFFLAARDQHGNAVVLRGTPQRPLRVAIERGRERGAWYRQWWFWTIVGAAVVGLGVGIPVGLTYGGDDEGPCEEALGHGCDIELRIER